MIFGFQFPQTHSLYKISLTMVNWGGLILLLVVIIIAIILLVWSLNFVGKDAQSVPKPILDMTL